jgi:PAS domain S-box-containing protein
MGKPTTDENLGRPTVLAVDDNEANLLALEAVLEETCNVVRAGSGAEAISVLESRSDIDVILLDVLMPGLDGYGTAGRIRRIKGSEDIPIVFVTAIYKEEPYIKRGYEAGGIDYFGKPFDPDVLKMKIAIYASFRQKARILQERERRVRESEELLRVGRKLAAVPENLSVGVLIADTEGRICQATDEVSRILGAGSRVDDGSSGAMLQRSDGRHALTDLNGALAQSLRDGDSCHGKPVQVRCLDGSTRTILSSTVPLRGVDSQIVGAVILIQDLTEHKQIEKDFEQRVVNLIGLAVEPSQRAALR